MHVYFSGIGGAGIAPLALIAKQAGWKVSGSDKQNSSYIDYLKKHGVTDINIGQSEESIKKIHDQKPIDWLVYSSAVSIEMKEAPELLFCKSHGIRISKRDEFLNQLLEEKRLSLIAIAGTHGKTTTTAMTVWLFTQLGIPISYLLPAKVSFGDMGKFDSRSVYFIYEADEFDRNFLAFTPNISLITGVSWDHHEIFPTREDYQAAFREFIAQSDLSLLWQEDFDYLNIKTPTNLVVQATNNPLIELIGLKGHYNRLDAWLAIQTVKRLTNKPISILMKIMAEFPGLQRRMEVIVPGLYSDYAHTPEKIRGCLSVASEMAEVKKQDIVVVYEPLTNRRQHHMLNDYKDCFDGASKIYWLPSYLAREDKDQRIITSEELISHLNDPTIAESAKLDNALKTNISNHLKQGDMVVCMAGGGGGSLDDWIRQHF